MDSRLASWSLPALLALALAGCGDQTCHYPVKPNETHIEGDARMKFLGTTVGLANGTRLSVFVCGSRAIHDSERLCVAVGSDTSTLTFRAQPMTGTQNLESIDAELTSNEIPGVAKARGVLTVNALERRACDPSYECVDVSFDVSLSGASFKDYWGLEQDGGRPISDISATGSLHATYREHIEEQTSTCGGGGHLIEIW